MTLRDAARCSVGSVMPVKSLELRHTIRLIRELDAGIKDIEAAIQSMMDEMQSPITTILGIGVHMGAMILAEVGDFSRFDSPDKILVYAGNVSLYLPIGAVFTVWCLFVYGETRLLLFALWPLQCHKTCLPLGLDFCRLP